MADINDLTLELCKQWKNNKGVNPLTNRKIKIGGPTFKKLEMKCIQLERNARSDALIRDEEKEPDEKPSIKIKLGLKKRPFLLVKYQNEEGIEVFDTSLLDTGANRSVITPEIAELLDLNVIGETRVIVGSGEVVVREIVEIIIIAINEDGDKFRKKLDVSVRGKVPHSVLAMDWIGSIQPSFSYIKPPSAIIS